MNGKLFKVFSISVLVMLVVGIVALAFPASVFAQAPQPPSKAPQGQEGRGIVERRLAMALKMAERRLREQAFLFKRMDQGINRAEALIKKLKANGKDTQALEAALTAFKSKKDEAFKVHEAAAAILEEHKGFDKGYKVTDPALARETIKSANEKMTEARKIAGPAYRDFMKVLREWLLANKPQETK